MEYVVIQVTLKEKFLGTKSGNLSELEGEINKQAAKGYLPKSTVMSSSGKFQAVSARDSGHFSALPSSVVRSVEADRSTPETGDG